MAPPDAACGLIQATRTPTTEAWISTPRRPSSRGGMAQAGHGWPALARWSHGRRSRAMRRAPLGRRPRPKPAIPPLLLLRSDADRGAMNGLTGTGKAAPWAAFFVAPDTCSPDSGTHPGTHQNGEPVTPDAACGLIRATPTPTTGATISTRQRTPPQGGMAQAGHGWPALARWSHGRRSRAMPHASLGRSPIRSRCTFHPTVPIRSRPAPAPPRPARPAGTA